MALRTLGIHRDVYADLSRARQRFETAVPGIKHMRDALMHFDDWARGEGKGPQEKGVKAGKALRDVASLYWGFAYHTGKDTITLGPYAIDVDEAVRAAVAFASAIYRAARAVDQRDTAELRSTTVNAITAAGLSCGAREDPIKVSPGQDLRIWVSLDAAAAGQERSTLSEQIVAALSAADLHLVSLAEPVNINPAERLRAGETMQVQASPANSP